MKKLMKWCILAIFTFSTGQLSAAESYGAAGDPLVAEVLGMEIRTKNENMMQAVIVQKLLEKYAREHKIEVSQKDIDLYIANLDTFMAKDRKERDAQILETEEKLKAGKLSEKEKENLQSSLNVLQNLYKMEIEEAKANAKNPEGILEDKQVVAKVFIEKNMIYKTLYAQYGGRIIAQQMGAEPFDALHKFLKEQEKNGSFKISDKSFVVPFWEYFTDESKHTFYKEGSKEEKEAFNKVY